MFISASGKNVIVELCDGGIQESDLNLPDETTPDVPWTGKVISIGEQVSLNLREGDVIYFDPYGGHAINENYVVNESSVLGTLEEDEVCAEGTNRDAIFEQIEDERYYQARKWGGAAADDAQSQENWESYIHEYSSGSNRAAGYDFRTRMLKTAALAVAAIESHDRQIASQAEPS